MIEQDIKRSKLRERQKIEENPDEIDIKLPEGHSHVSLADCIRNIKLYGKLAF